MPNQQDLNFLKKCIAESNIKQFNEWRKDVADLEEDQIEKDIIGVKLRKIDLKEADLFGANLEGAMNSMVEFLKKLTAQKSFSIPLLNILLKIR